MSDDRPTPPPEPPIPEQAPATDPPEEAEPSGLNQPWVRFAVGFGVLVAVSETLYHAVALESDAFYQFLCGLAWISSVILTPFYDSVDLMGSRIQTEDFTVTVNYGCDGLQVCTLLSSAILAFPSSWKQKLIGVVAGNVWLQGWNITRIATLVVIGGIEREAFEPVHVYVWPTILVVVCMATWMVWAQWTMSDDEDTVGA